MAGYEQDLLDRIDGHLLDHALFAGDKLYGYLQSVHVHQTLLERDWTGSERMEAPALAAEDTILRDLARVGLNGRMSELVVKRIDADGESNGVVVTTDFQGCGTIGVDDRRLFIMRKRIAVLRREGVLAGGQRSIHAFNTAATREQLLADGVRYSTISVLEKFKSDC